jgi:plasmid stability protein
MSHLAVDLPDALAARLHDEARLLGKSPENYAVEILQSAVAPAENHQAGALASGLEKLRSVLTRIPAVRVLSSSDGTQPYWYVKLAIDIRSKIAWHIIQELGFVLNYLSLEERLPTVFMPVSPPPYLNGGPEDFLAWVIEAKLPFVDAGVVAEILEGRLPRPIDDEQQWLA